MHGGIHGNNDHDDVHGGRRRIFYDPVRGASAEAGIGNTAACAMVSLAMFMALVSIATFAAASVAKSHYPDHADSQ